MENLTSSSEREQVEFYISCGCLKNLDLLSKSDPQVKLYFKNAKNGWTFIEETEIIKNNLNPTFTKTFLVDFIFETHQHIKFEIVDCDGPNSSQLTLKSRGAKSHLSGLIGTVETTVGTIMGAKRQTLVSEIKNKDKCAGALRVRGEKVDSNAQSVSWQWSGVKLKNTDGWFGKSDPFLRFYNPSSWQNAKYHFCGKIEFCNNKKPLTRIWERVKETIDLESILVHTTEVIRNDLNPIWKPFSISVKKLCEEHYKTFMVECWDREGSGKHQLIGYFRTSLQDIESGKTEFPLYNYNKKHLGALRISNFSIHPQISFVNYLRGGTQLNIAVAIDFNGSNGNPTSASSLHYRSMDPPNEYYQAISAVCPIVLKYDSDQLVPLYGFGGTAPWTRGTSHCFPLTGTEENEEVHGTEGILDTYYKCLDSVGLSGPTNFATVIETVNAKCKQIKETESDQYMVLLILTNGEITDMEETTRAIIKASELPLSIIIVGVGNAGFTQMKILDGDEGELKSKKEKASRDLVQFVPFRDFKDDPEILARQVLAEVPEQFLKYMELVGRKPLTAQVFDMNQISTVLPPSAEAK